MEERFWVALIASCLAALTTTLGILTIRQYEHWAREKNSYFICFAAGVLIAASFLHIVPKSITMAAQAPAYLLIGYLGLHLFNRFLTAYVCEKEPAERFLTGIIPLFGIGLHSFIDGFIYSITYSVDSFTGTLATLGMILHEFPEGIITYLLLLNSGFTPRRALILALIAAALSTPLGMLISYPFLRQNDQRFLGTCLALSAGSLIYVGASHLLPQAERDSKSYSLLALTAGVVVAIGIVLTGG